jgi:hypothetical protein
MLESEPQRFFYAIKPLYPHFVHRRAKNGQLVRSFAAPEIQ